MEATGARDYRRDCKYGSKCYQKNPEHKAKFRHPNEVRDLGKDQEDKENKGNKRSLSDESTADNEDQLEQKQEIKKVKHDVSESESEVGSQDEEEKKEEGDEVFTDLVSCLSESTKERVDELYSMRMPEDFYSLFEFCKSVDPSKPLEALSSVGLKLCGAFEVLADTVPLSAPKSRGLYLSHYRYYFDPPEMQTLVCEVNYKTGLHLGYYRDSPSEAPVMVVSGVESQGPALTVLGDNIFAALYNHLLARLDTADPFTRTKMASMVERLKLWVNKRSMEGSDSLNLERRTAGMKNRDRLKVTSGAHGAGIVVPYNKKTELGYRPIPETPAGLKKILNQVLEADTEEARDSAMDPLQELVTCVQFANDEGDPGMGLELGTALLCHGGDVLHTTIKHLLCVSYDLLNRDLFVEVVTSHLARRVRGREPDSFKKWRQ